MDENARKNGRSDHDILIELTTKLDRAISDIRDLNTHVVKSTSNLQAEKVDKDTFNKWEQDFRRDYEKEIDNVKEKLVTDLSVISKTVTDSFKDHEDRLRRVERVAFIGIGGLAMLQIIIGILK